MAQPAGIEKFKVCSLIYATSTLTRTVSLKEQGKNSFYFDIKITDETNSKDEKALYIKETFNGFAKILGRVHEQSYIYVQDVRAATYGFGGYTQEYRYHH